MLQDHPSATWLSFLIGMAFILYSLFLQGCQSAPMPEVNAHFWAGDSAQSGITRAQESQTMACRSPEFDQMVCLSYSDLGEIFNLLLQCERWPER
jgi:hypothetical protein